MSRFVYFSPNRGKGRGFLKAVSKDKKRITRVNKKEIGRDDNLVIYGLFEQDLFSKTENYWYIDNGYLERGEYFRMVKNGLYYHGKGNADHTRFNSLGIKLNKWNTGGINGGEKIILVAPGFWSKKILHEENWFEETKKELSKYTDRPILNSLKRGIKSRKNLHIDPPITWNESIWCVVTCSSNIVTDCLIRGIPVITTKYTNIGSLKDIENPPGEESREILYSLANQQWKKKSFTSGKVWDEVDDSCIS